MRLALITDIHEDLPSLQRIIKKAEHKGFDRLICLGDICGFSLPYYKYRDQRSASECLRLIRKKCDIVIPGNHDLHAASRIPENSDIFSFPDDWYELNSGERLALAKDIIWNHGDDLCPGFSYDDVEFIRSLPEFQVLESPEHKIMMSHYAFPNLSGFARKFYSWEKEFEAHFRFMETHDCSMAFLGHAHSRGFYSVIPEKFTHKRLREARLNKTPLIIGIPPVTRNHRRRGFCIFDSETQLLKLHH